MTTSPWHALTIDEVCKQLDTSTSTGLTPAQIQQRQARWGKNVVTFKQRLKLLRFIGRQLHQPLVYVLLASGLIALAMQRITDGLVVLAVIVINTLLGIIQEYRADQAIAALATLVPESCLAIRDGVKNSYDVKELVPGDLVLLTAGERIPADIRLVESRHLKVDESPLTGESLPVEKDLELVSDPAGIGDRLNMAFSGTLALSGSAQGIVVATGRETALGSISTLMETTTEVKTPLVARLERTSLLMSIIIVGLALCLFGLGMMRGYAVADAGLAAISLAVGSIPEGLPPIITIVLALGARRMAYRHAVIRRLPAIETLGATAVICTDKTGTLTQNQMTVREILTLEQTFQVEGIGYRPEGKILEQGKLLVALPHSLQALLQACCLCNDAILIQRGEDWTISGDPTEGALLVAAAKGSIHLNLLRHSYKRIDVHPFDSQTQMMATLHQQESGAHIIFLKGSPEAIMARCSTPWTRALHDQALQLAKQGRRLLAFAHKPLAPESTLTQDLLTHDFELMGIVGMIDPPRPEAITSVRICQEAGIVVKMITGDHPVTAEAIGAELGLEHPHQVLTGAELDHISDQELRQHVKHYHIFARVAPQHKLRLVQALQANNEVVTMTGDGVNDAPALKQADVGVAMGISGTSVAKETADLVLLDDRFSSIEAAVEEGRRVYDNIVKALVFILPTNFALGLILLASVALFPAVEGNHLLPLLPSQILWINLISAIGLSFPLALEAIERDAMKRPPRPRHEPLLSGFVWFRTILVSIINTIGILSLFLWEYLHSSQELAILEAQTVATTTVIFFQCFYLLNCRSLHRSVLAVGLFSNVSIYLGIVVVLALSAVFIYAPWFNEIFHSTPLGIAPLLRALAVGFLILPIISIEKWIYLNLRKRARLLGNV